MKSKAIIKNLIIMFLMASSLAFAEKLGSQDIFITINNPDYEVSEIKVLRIASDDSAKVFCQKLHWFLEPYWAPKEWYVTLKFEESDEGKYETTVKRDPYQNNFCGSSLVTELNITLYDSVEGKKFSFGSYLYTDGGETIHLRAKVSYNQGEWESAPSHKIIFETIDRYVDENDSFIDVEVTNMDDSK